MSCAQEHRLYFYHKFIISLGNGVQRLPVNVCLSINNFLFKLLTDVLNTITHCIMKSTLFIYLNTYQLLFYLSPNTIFILIFSFFNKIFTVLITPLLSFCLHFSSVSWQLSLKKNLILGLEVTAVYKQLVNYNLKLCKPADQLCSFTEK